MTDLIPIRTTDMPTEMNALLHDYPRDAWAANPHFAKSTRQWMRAHEKFRVLSDHLHAQTTGFLDRSVDPDGFADHLGRYGTALVRNLHGHHHFEDREFFPELSAADPRFDVGLEILEKDHAALDQVLENFSRTGSRVIKLVQLDEAAAREEAGILETQTRAIRAFLDRHLGDEEDLAVPVILHHALRG